MRWGLIPGWKTTAKEMPSTFNARAEMVAEKPMFRSAFKRTRCIVSASGYYEGRPVEGGKQPVSAVDCSVLSIAGLTKEKPRPLRGRVGFHRIAASFCYSDGRSLDPLCFSYLLLGRL